MYSHLAPRESRWFSCDRYGLQRPWIYPLGLRPCRARFSVVVRRFRPTRAYRFPPACVLSVLDPCVSVAQAFFAVSPCGSLKERHWLRPCRARLSVVEILFLHHGQPRKLVQFGGHKGRSGSEARSVGCSDKRETVRGFHQSSLGGAARVIRAKTRLTSLGSFSSWWVVNCDLRH